MACDRDHDLIKSSPEAFEAGTVRLPHHQHAEAFQDDGDGGALWIRNCAGCRTSLTLPVEVRHAA